MSTIERTYYDCAIADATTKIHKAIKHGQAYGAPNDFCYEVKTETQIPSYNPDTRNGATAVYTCNWRTSLGRLFILRVDFTGHARGFLDRKRTELEDFARRTLLHAQQDPRLQNSRMRSEQNGPVAIYTGPDKVRRVQFGSEKQGKGAVCVPQSVQSRLPFGRRFQDATNPSREREPGWGGHDKKFAFEVPVPGDYDTEDWVEPN